jgi:hypothetical protein
MRRVGGFTGEAEMDVWRRGRACWAKRQRPRLDVRGGE